MIRIIGGIASLGFMVVALLHFVWMFSPWPLHTWADWSHAFGGANFRVPHTIMFAVAVLFAAATHVVAVVASLSRPVAPMWLYRWGARTISVVFILRATIGFWQMSRALNHPEMPAAFRETTIFYLSIYLPLFLVLGVLTGVVELAASRQSRGADST